MKRKRTEVTIETDEIWIIRQPGRGFVAWCPACGEQTTMITPDEASLLTELNARDIYRHLEAGLLHYAEMAGGIVLVCSNSIVRLKTDAIDKHTRYSGG